MTFYRRARQPGGIYFFTVVTHRRLPILQSAAAVQRLRTAMRQTMRRRPFRIDAVVILPDHLHAVWTLPPGDDDFSTRWRLVKYRFSLGYEEPSAWASLRSAHPTSGAGGGERSRLRRRERAVWQRRFWEHTIRDEADFRRHVDYVHYNPVKHGLIERARDWPYSSLERYVARGVYPADWGVGEPDTIRGLEVE